MVGDGALLATLQYPLLLSGSCVGRMGCYVKPTRPTPRSLHLLSLAKGNSFQDSSLKAPRQGYPSISRDSFGILLLEPGKAPRHFHCWSNRVDYPLNFQELVDIRMEGEFFCEKKLTFTSNGFLKVPEILGTFLGITDPSFEPTIEAQI